MKQRRHDIMALTKAMAEAAGEAEVVHSRVDFQRHRRYGSCVAAGHIVLLRQQLCNLIAVCADVAESERDTVMLGRTHGQAAGHRSFGLKAAVWLGELRRQLIRLDEASPRITVGKFLGAVGTGAAQGEHARELQHILTHLGLGVRWPPRK